MLEHLRRFIDKIFEIKEKKVEKGPEVRQNFYVPRKKNIIYPNDEFAEKQMLQWIDEIWWKHHG